MTSGQIPTAATASPVEDPYVGLTYFTEEYVDFFFGRDEECALIIGNLRAARLTLLYAESGVGKSSVLRAGVVARLHGFAGRDAESRGLPRLVPVIFSSWSERPVAALVRAVEEAIRPYLEEAKLPELPEDDLEAALEAAGEAIDGTLLIILDQFEEHFLYPEDDAGQDPVAAQMARCVNRPDLRANFLISIREDSYAQLGDLFQGKIKNVYGNFLHMDFLGRAGAREAIERPLERMNERRPEAEPFTVEAALVEAVLRQVGRDEEDDKIETTYLQLVMRRLWEEETAAGSHVLRLQTLEALGGAEAIIGSHLDRAMEGADGDAGLSRGQRRVAASIFRFLVTSGGTKIALTVADLADLTGLAAAEIEPVLRHLSSPRLHILRPVVFEGGSGEPRFEIFHDALATPIVDWRTRVEKEEREARGRRQRAEKEEAQRAAAEAEARAQRERQRKRAALAALAVAVVALLGVATYFAIHQKNVADRRDADNQSVRAARRIEVLSFAPSFGPSAAALASVEAYRLSPTDEARNQALAQLQLNPGMPEVLAGHTRPVSAVAFWPGSGNLVSGGFDGTVRLWSEEGGKIGSPLITDAGVLGVAVSKPLADETRVLAAALDTGALELWRITAAGKVKPGSNDKVPVSDGEIWGLAFEPQAPGVLAFGDSDGLLGLLDVTREKNPRPLDAEYAAGKILDFAFGPDGHQLFVATRQGGEVFELGDASFGPSISARSGHPVFAAATAANGSYAFAGAGRIDLWDAAREREVHLRSPAPVNSLAFADRGSVLVSGGEDWHVTTWDVKTGRSFGPPRPMASAEVNDVAISSDGRTIAAAAGDGLLKLWPLEPGQGKALATAVGSLSPGETDARLPKVYGLAVGAGGRVAAAGGPAGTTIWSLRDLPATDSPPQPLARIEGRTRAVAYHRDILVTGRGDSFAVYGTGKACRGRGPQPCLLGAPERPHSKVPVESLALRRYGSQLLFVSTAFRDGKGFFNLWDLSQVKETGEVSYLSSSNHLETEVHRLTFSPVDRLVAAGAEDGKTRVWDVRDPEDPEGITFARARGNENQAVAAVAFSQDGSLLASGGEDQQVVLWRVQREESGRVTVERMPETLFQSQTIFSLAFSPDGEILAAGDGDGSTCLYEVESRRPIGSPYCLLGPHSEAVAGGVDALKFAQLGEGRPVLLSAGTGQPIIAWDSILWNLSDDAGVEEKIAGYVCRLAGRNLTQAEWNSVFASTDLADDRHRTCARYPLGD